MKEKVEKLIKLLERYRDDLVEFKDVDGIYVEGMIENVNEDIFQLECYLEDE